MSDENKPTIFIISDGTGRTAEQVIMAALVQFEKIYPEIKIFPQVTSKNQIPEIMAQAHKEQGMVIHTVVSRDLGDYINHLGRLYTVNTIDLMGPVLAQLSRYFAYLPSEKPGIYYDLNKSYFKRIEAVEYTLRHDDGQRSHELDKAEIVILGVSRTFKTPVSIYLAHNGWLVANVPIIMGMEPPDHLFKVSPDRVFCLTTHPDHLAQLRRVREKHLGGNVGEYAKPAYILKELEFALGIYRRQSRWTMIDITHKPIEEISMEILTTLRQRGI